MRWPLLLFFAHFAFFAFPDLSRPVIQNSFVSGYRLSDNVNLAQKFAIDSTVHNAMAALAFLCALRVLCVSRFFSTQAKNDSTFYRGILFLSATYTMIMTESQ